MSNVKHEALVRISENGSSRKRALRKTLGIIREYKKELKEYERKVRKAIWFNWEIHRQIQIAKPKWKVEP